VIIASADGSGNTTVPPLDPGWDNVGTSSATAIYLGNRRVLTASHVGSGTTNLAGTNYNVVPGSEVRLTNGGVTFTDLLIYEIDTDPGLPTLNLSTAPPPVGSTVFMIGQGRDRLPNLTEWNAVMSGGNWIWSEVPSNGAFAGYKWGPGSTKRWGTNTIDDNNVVVNAGFGEVTSLQTTFSQLIGTSEAQAAAGDSGGAMFYFNPTILDFELVGVMEATSAFHGQPSDTSIFGTSTFGADVSFYRSQILAMTAAPHIDGDINRDGAVDIADFTLWGDAFGTSGSSPSDISGDGIVDIADFTLWGDNFTGTSGVGVLGPEGSGMSISAVPEPSAWIMLATGAGLLYAYALGRRRNAR